MRLENEEDEDYYKKDEKNEEDKTGQDQEMRGINWVG